MHRTWAILFWEHPMTRTDLERKSRPLPVIDPERCNGCGLCVRACASGAMAIGGGKAFVARPEACIYGGLCARICPLQAVCLPIEIVFGEESEPYENEPDGSRRKTQ